MRILWFVWLMTQTGTLIHPTGFETEDACLAAQTAYIDSMSDHIENSGLYEYRIWGDCVAVVQHTE